MERPFPPLVLKQKSSVAEPVARGWDRMGSRLLSWNEYPAVTAVEMGRAAGKVEEIEEQVGMLRHVTGEGRACLPDLALAGDVGPSRISFPEPPAFGPCPWMTLCASCMCHQVPAVSPPELRRGPVALRRPF